MKGALLKFWKLKILNLMNQENRQISDYEAILRKNKAAKSVAKIVLNERKGTGSVVWDYFGALMLRGKSVLKKLHFCKIGFEMELITFKGFSQVTSTSNLLTHLRNVHDIELKSKNSEASLKKTNEALSSSSKDKDTKFVNGRRFDVPNEDAECLEWWQKNEEMFPNIALLANFCFGIPATSASSEEDFQVLVPALRQK
ncbi:hypothetical protein FF38_01555 [Lucilia cuprina]|uniref:HAT C-terminal dimerisation domain-containing protein n=1 Tax=Lucilia cuprina TaxID=7375 RepID=A0A0L0BUN4_LUCCU|nr:hypothetical protein FF38_01555 [Lucilia cuprina]